MPEYSIKRKRMESLRRSNNSSVLQIIQTLEFCGKEVLHESPFVVSSMNKHFASHLLGRKDAAMMEPRILFETSVCIERDADIVEHCNDDDTFLTAKSIPESVTPRVDAIVFPLHDKSFDIGAVTPITKTNPRRTTPRSYCTSSSDFCNNDLSRQIEAMVLEAETSYENRPKRSKPTNARHLSAEHSTIYEVGHSSNTVTTKSLVTMKNIAFCTPTRKTIQDKTLEKMKLVTPSPRSKSNALELFSRMFHAQDSPGVPALMPVGSTTSLSSELSTGRSSDNNFSLNRMKFVKNIAATQRNETWTLFSV